MIHRIPVSLEPSTSTRIDDLDLHALLAERGGGGGRLHLLARTPDGRALPVQWLDGAAPATVRGHRRGTLLLGATGAGQVDLFVLAQAAGQAKDAVAIKETADLLEIDVQGKRFADYRWNTKGPELRRPLFHPLMSPGGVPFTQLGEVPDKKEKHFHHTALWIAHQNWTAKGLPNLDNWQMNKNCTKIEHGKFDVFESGPLAGRFVEKLSWQDPKNEKVLVAETRTVTIPSRPAASRALDIDLTLAAQDLPITFNRTPYHLIAVRVLDAMLPAKGGLILNSEGQKNPPDGAAAKWIDISGKLENEALGVALFNHPDNPRHPTPCLNFSGQTIGLSPTHKEPLTVEAGKEVRFRFRVLVHAGSAEEGKVAAEYEAYAKPGKARLGGVEKVEV